MCLHGQRLDEVEAVLGVFPVRRSTGSSTGCPSCNSDGRVMRIRDPLAESIVVSLSWPGFVSPSPLKHETWTFLPWNSVRLISSWRAKSDLAPPWAIRIAHLSYCATCAQCVAREERNDRCCSNFPESRLAAYRHCLKDSASRTVDCPSRKRPNRS